MLVIKTNRHITYHFTAIYDQLSVNFLPLYDTFYKCLIIILLVINIVKISCIKHSLIKLN